MVAEGVENDWQAAVAAAQFDLLQGFYLATPMALPELIEFQAARPLSAKLAPAPLVESIAQKFFVGRTAA